MYDDPANDIPISGRAFQHQPTFGENIKAAIAPTDSNGRRAICPGWWHNPKGGRDSNYGTAHPQGNWWIGTADNYQGPGSGTNPGTCDTNINDAGRIVSPWFRLGGEGGGSCPSEFCRAPFVQPKTPPHFPATVRV